VVCLFTSWVARVDLADINEWERSVLECDYVVVWSAEEAKQMIRRKQQDGFDN